jgi:hypothetical protein
VLLFRSLTLFLTLLKLVGEPIDKACTLQTAHKLLTQEVAALEARLLYVRMAEQRLAGKVLEALGAPENSNPFGPEPETEPEPELPSPVLEPPSTMAVDTAPPLPDSSYSPPILEGQENLHVPNHPDTHLNYSHDYFNNPILLRATQSLEDHRGYFPEDDDSLSTRSVGVIEAARNSLRYESAADDDIAIAFGCGDILPLSFLSNLASCNGRRRIRRRGDAPSFVEPIPRNASTISRTTAVTTATPVVVEGENDQYRATVNWATGLSGHSGLSQAAKPKNQAGTPLRNIRMMSEHRGAAHIGPFSKGFTPSFSATSW